jgi:ATP-dependent exoDNAse (exonuclease V) beta subunit
VARARLETARLLAGAERLARHRAAARVLQQTPSSMAISSLSHEFFRERRSEEIDAELANPDAPRLAGSIVHRILEHVDLGRPLIDSLEEALGVGAAHARGLGSGAADEEAAWKIAAEVIRELMAGPLPDSFDAIRAHVLARELPLLVPPADTGKDEHLYASGVIDLVYRDPRTREIVVADYKTDRGDASLAVRTYSPQLQEYARALMDAWILDTMPRTELWLLREGVVEPCLP